jgi:hypothetical protein
MDYCGSIFAALASFSAMSASLAIRTSKASGVHDHLLDAERVSLLLVAGLLIALTISACILATTSRGVFFGTKAPTQKSKSESARPASMVVGTSGSAAARLEARHRKRQHLAVLDQRQAGVIGAEIDVDAAGHRLGQRLRRALERHQLAFEARGQRKRSIVRCGGVPMPAAP